MKKIGIIMLFLCLAGCGVISANMRGMTRAQVKDQKGMPVSVMRENNAEMWTYRQDDCSEYVFFDTEGIVRYTERKGSCGW